MAFQTLNPFTNEVEEVFEEMSDRALSLALDTAQKTYETWREVSIEDRARLMQRVASLLRHDAKRFAKYPTLEMGKLSLESENWEVKVCADIAAYYARNAEKFLAKEMVPTNSGSAYVLSEPIGVLLGIMPWNFPYYQVFRFVVPNLMAGNVCLIKHASNVPQCAIAMEKLFQEAGFPEGAYTNLLVCSKRIGSIIDDKRIRGVSLTGSEAAGSQVAERAGGKLKKSVMELGGSDPFIVLADADLDHAVQTAVEGKMFNSGQCCAASKRFILLKPIAEEFLSKFIVKMGRLQPGDPRQLEAGFAPMVSVEQANVLLNQVQESVKKGAKVLLGGNRPDLIGAFFNPTILIDIKPGMPAFDQELFGPVANLFIAQNEPEAIEIANSTDFGLGSVICTRDKERAQSMARRLEAGMVYINTVTISEPGLPFGGVKNSGFGRELAHLGIQEFLNKKLVRIG